MRKISYFIFFICLFLCVAGAMLARAENAKDKILTAAGNDVLLVESSDPDTTLPSGVVDLTTASTTVSIMNITPETLNLASQGRWITVHLFLPSGYKAGDVDISSVKLNNTLSSDPSYKGLNHYRRGDLAQGSSSGNLVLKFSRSDFQALVDSPSGDFAVTVTGTVKGQAFSVSDTVYILNTSLQPEGTLVKSDEADEVYIIKNNRKRHIPSPTAFERRGLQWQNIKKLSQTELNSYPEDELIKPNSSPAVYLIIAGMKRHLPSVEIFESYGFDWNDISVVDLSEVNDYTDVTLIKVPDDAKVYLLAGGKRHWIPSAAIFNSHGYKWDQIIIVNAAEKDATAEGEALQ